MRSGEARGLAEPSWAPAAGVVDVWVAGLDPSPPALAALAALLSPAERERADRFRDGCHRRRQVATRGWLRRVLGACLDIRPEAVPLAPGGGKPALAWPGFPPLHFNLSHAGDVLVIAVAGQEVGVDVEPWPAGALLVDAPAVFCTPAEQARLDGLPAEARPAGLLRCWTAKEACLKAAGPGLATDPRTLEVGWGPGPDEAGAATGGRWWRIRMLDAVAGHLVAVAAEGDAWSARARPAAELADR